jgi:hypothetical protein
MIGMIEKIHTTVINVAHRHHMFNLQCHTVLVHHSAGSEFPKWLANQGIDDESWVHCYTE